MTPSYVSSNLRLEVIERAQGRCEYCLFPQDSSFLSFEIEHIISEKHGGETILENLALACPDCNRFKGTDLGSLDSESGKLTPFFNPRTQNWQEHFQLEGSEIIPRTSQGRVTVAILKFNRSDHVAERERLIKAGKFTLP
jgi:hypothetical protein